MLVTEPYSLIQLVFLLAPDAVLMSLVVGQVEPLFVDSYQTRSSRDFSRVWLSSQATPPTTLHSVSETPMLDDPMRTGIAPVPAILHAPLALAHAVPAQF